MAGARAGAGGERRREGGHGQVPGPLQTTHHRRRAPGLFACCSRPCLLMSAAVFVLPCAGLDGCECRSTVANAARRLRMPMLLAPLSSLLSCVLARVVWRGVLCSAVVRPVINSSTYSAPTMTASSKCKKKTLACISRSSAPSTPASRRRPPRRHASSLFATSASARLRRSIYIHVFSRVCVVYVCTHTHSHAHAQYIYIGAR
jgi:hypothetical protein